MMTANRWAWKQPSFEESVVAHQSSEIAPKMYRDLRFLLKRQVNEKFTVAEYSVN